MNYRTIRYLKPYKGADINRLHTERGFSYFGRLNGNQYDRDSLDGDWIKEKSLKALKETIRQKIKGEK